LDLDSVSSNSDLSSDSDGENVVKLAKPLAPLAPFVSKKAPAYDNLGKKFSD
jgi:hypothetical protein